MRHIKELVCFIILNCCHSLIKTVCVLTPGRCVKAHTFGVTLLHLGSNFCSHASDMESHAFLIIHILLNHYH